MTYGRSAWGNGAYGGATAPLTSPGVIIADPTNPAGPGYRWLTQLSTGPWAGTAYAGGGLVDRPAAGGMSLVADADQAIVRITAWWTGAPYLRVVRILADGTRTPVRGGYPIATVIPTRRNLCTNPSLEVDLAGWLSGANTTLTRVAGTALEGAAFARLKATAAGAVTATVPVATIPTTAPFGVSFNLNLSANPSGAVTVAVAWVDQNGTAMSSTSATIAAGTLSTYVGRWGRTPALLITPPAPIVTYTSGQVTGMRYPAGGALTVSVAGMAANATADVDGVLVEPGDSALNGTFFDGSYPLGAWTGTANASASLLAAAQTVEDADAPLDVPVRYELTAPDQATFKIVSEPIVLASNGRSWLTHPDFPRPLRVEPQAAPQQTYTLERALHTIVGSDLPIAVTAGVRQAETGTLVVPVENFGERDRLLEMLRDGQAMLLRAPADFGRGPGQWLSVGDVDVAAPGHGAWEGTRRFTLPYAECAPPVAPFSVAAA